MKRHNLTESDLIQAIHKNGFLSIEEIETAFFETNGKITIVPRQRPFTTGHRENK
jgi:uncharacterized membrane protein YcaP (DUF421 family)